MIPLGVVATVSLLYFGLLFAVAWYADRQRAFGKSLVDNPTVYSLSLAVYCTSWTFYGSVGRAATHGIDFLAIYLGPTMIAFSWWFLLRKMVRISKEQNIVSIADFISSRYGKSAFLGAVITIFAVLGIMPYIALQLKAVARTFDLLVYPFSGANGALHFFPRFDVHFDTAFIVAMILGVFGVLFGARHLDAAERHEGLVAAIALESVVKIIAFVCAGLFVTYGLFDGFTDIFHDFLTRMPERSHLLLVGADVNTYAHWFSLTFISMMAIIFLPRQFHIMVIENCREEHIRSAMWRFPAYMFIINLFVIPIALGGLLLFNGNTQNADFFVITLPLQFGQPWLALLVFIGGFSASAGMVMVSSVALSTMILNHLIMPIILKLHSGVQSLSTLLINIKRLGIVATIFLGYLYYRLLGESTALVNIGLISFVAATQFAPSAIGGLYWRRATRRGATAGLICGFIVWFYTLLIPAFVNEGWLDQSLLDRGLFNLSIFKPTALFGLDGFDIWTHSLFWTMLLNIGCFLAFSLLSRPTTDETEQVKKFVDVYKKRVEGPQRTRITKAPSVVEFVELMAKFIGEKQAHQAITNYLGDREIDEKGSLSEQELPKLKRFTELTLAGSVGAAPARIIIDNYLSARGSRLEDIFDIFGSVNISRTASREQLSVLFDAARAVASGRNLQEVLDEILIIFTDQFKFDLCVIRILDADRQALTVRSQRGMSSKHFGESERDLTMDTYIGETFLTNQITVVNDTDFVAKHQTAEIIRREQILSFAHAPITVEGEPIGVLSAFSKSAKGIFTEEFVELFSSLAGQVGVAWRNAQQTDQLITAREQERELAIAKDIQLGLLPTKTPELPGVHIAGICLPAKEVGGDYYDYLSPQEDRLDLVVADVSGHNVGAALIMAETRTMIRARSAHHGSPKEILKELNSFFYDDLTRAELFISMFYLQYLSASREVIYASAGHPPPLWYKAAGHQCHRLDAEGLIIGVMKDFQFENKKAHFEPGDVLLLYTDGVIEAMNERNELFGEERLKTLLLENSRRSPEGMIEKILEQVRLFSGHHNFQDDVSLIVMQVAAEADLDMTSD
ncbi:MAG: SpoIIE family protein phosphatase [Deltaproteobacteria bacterium]|jgi:Na+/proline symporter/serine phosphatase RsbU (regulator of sigma subunit)|nr:SpoIIE family protein phosphatase [Deltaproteobacteria bacterium]